MCLWTNERAARAKNYRSACFAPHTTFDRHHSHSNPQPNQHAPIGLDACAYVSIWARRMSMWLGIGQCHYAFNNAADQEKGRRSTRSLTDTLRSTDLHMQVHKHVRSQPNICTYTDSDERPMNVNLRMNKCVLSIPYVQTAIRIVKICLHADDLRSYRC